MPPYKPLLGAELTKVAAWVKAQPDWTPLEVVGDFMAISCASEPWK